MFASSTWRPIAFQPASEASPASFASISATRAISRRSSCVSPSTSSSRRSSSICSVIRATRSSPRPGTSASVRTGPHSTRHRDRKLSRRSNSRATAWNVCAVPLRPSAATSMRAAPVRSGASCGSLWLVPSGKIRMLPPPARWLAILSNVASLSPALLFGVSCLRTIGTAPARSSSQRNPGTFHSVDFEIGEISQSVSVSTRIGSISAL